jgi:hypothetical protein
LLGAQIAGASAHIEAGDAFDPAVLKKLAPAADRVVVKEQRIGGLLAAPPSSKSTKAFTRRGARQRRKRLAIVFAGEARMNHACGRIHPTRKRKKFLPALE